MSLSSSSSSSSVYNHGHHHCVNLIQYKWHWGCYNLKSILKHKWKGAVTLYVISFCSTFFNTVNTEKFSFRRFGPDNNSYWRLWNWWKDECNKLESSVWRGENLSFPCRGLAFNIFSCSRLTSLKIFSQQQKVDVKVKIRKCKETNVSIKSSFIFTAVMMIFCYFLGYIKHWSTIQISLKHIYCLGLIIERKP